MSDWFGNPTPDILIVTLPLLAIALARFRFSISDTTVVLTLGVTFLEIIKIGGEYILTYASFLIPFDAQVVIAINMMAASDAAVFALMGMALSCAYDILKQVRKEQEVSEE